MPSLGIIALNQNQKERYYKDIGKYAEQLELNVHQFVPNAIDPYTEQITGETFDPGSGNWKPATFAIPDVLYDRCFYTSNQAYKTNAPIVEWLKNRTLFLGFGLPNKSKVYETLQNEPDLQPYTIDTLKAEHADSIIEELDKKKDPAAETGKRLPGKRHPGFEKASRKIHCAHRPPRKNRAKNISTEIATEKVARYPVNPDIVFNPAVFNLAKSEKPAL